MSGNLTIADGYYTSNGANVVIPVRSGFDYFETINQTQIATTAGTGVVVKSEWNYSMADASAIIYKKTNSTDALNATIITSAGFTPVNSGTVTLGAPKTITAITAASPAVVTSASHGYAVGTIVRLYGTTGQLQTSGQSYTITSVATNTFTLGYLDASGFAAAATAGYARSVSNLPMFYPSLGHITKITQASSAVITLAVTHGLTVNQIVRINVPSAYGMVEIDGLLGTITAVSTANNTITVNINSTAFTAFAYPVSGTQTTYAQIEPVGDANGVLDGATNNVSSIGMLIAGGAQSPGGADTDVIYWRAVATSFSNP